MILALIPLFAVLNRLRGWNPVEDFKKAHGMESYEMALRAAPAWMRWVVRTTSDGLVAGYAGLIVGSLACYLTGINSHNLALALLVFAGMWVWEAPSWGAGFAAINGKWRANGTLSRFVERLSSDATVRGILYMSARGFLGFIPLAAGLALWGHPLAGGLLAAAGLAQGVVYNVGGIHQRLTGKDTGIKISEVLMGGLIGACFASMGA